MLDWFVFKAEEIPNQSLAEWVKDKYGYSSAFYSISDITVGMGLVEINQVVLVDFLMRS